MGKIVPAADDGQKTQGEKSGWRDIHHLALNNSSCRTNVRTLCARRNHFHLIIGRITTNQDWRNRLADRMANRRYDRYRIQAARDAAEGGSATCRRGTGVADFLTSISSVPALRNFVLASTRIAVNAVQFAANVVRKIVTG